ncbi:hypothetical protein EJB05_49061 [Eragrostis curvula]|uniref:Uncharacterized protein n=1 Tax=Eragrostis curvula TaxID=38414 RepID=A0A5J9T3S6_9POAL|nr:hypothetical protein EJB05_49061 [Eragrostis curvula]
MSDWTAGILTSSASPGHSDHQRAEDGSTTDEDQRRRPPRFSWSDQNPPPGHLLKVDTKVRHPDTGRRTFRRGRFVPPHPPHVASGILIKWMKGFAVDEMAYVAEFESHVSYSWLEEEAELLSSVSWCVGDSIGKPTPAICKGSCGSVNLGVQVWERDFTSVRIFVSARSKEVQF